MENFATEISYHYGLSDAGDRAQSNGVRALSAPRLLCISLRAVSEAFVCVCEAVSFSFFSGKWRSGIFFSLVALNILLSSRTRVLFLRFHNAVALIVLMNGLVNTLVSVAAQTT